MALLDLKVRIIPDMKELNKELQKKRKTNLGGAVQGATGGGGAGGGGQTIKVQGIGRVLKLLGAGLAIFTALDFILKPILSILTAVLTLLFLPLLPIFKPVFERLAKDLPIFAENMIKVKDFVQRVIDFLFGGGIVDFVKNFFGDIWNSLVEAWNGLKDFGKRVWKDFIVPGWEQFKEDVVKLGQDIIELILKGWEFFQNIGLFIWNTILKPAWEWFLNIGNMIWENILKPAWEWFLDIGERIWNLIKGGFEFLRDKINALAESIGNFIGKIISTLKSILGFQTGGFVPGPVGKPQLAIVHGGEQVLTPQQQINAGGGGGGNVTISINNPTVRNDNDIKEIANQVSQILQAQTRRRFT